MKEDNEVNMNLFNKEKNEDLKEFKEDTKEFKKEDLKEFKNEDKPKEFIRETLKFKNLNYKPKYKEIFEFSEDFLSIKIYNF
jgi:hypothetical protein